jgi:uncharacterized protein (TIGR02452 family)
MQDRLELARVWQDTRVVADMLPPPPPSRKHRYDPDGVGAPPGGRTQVAVHNADAIDVGAAMVRAGLRPLVLNLANDRTPGGGVAHGAVAQEESLFRRTNYHRTLLPELYPLRDDEAVYSPGVTVFRASAARGHRFVPPWRLDFVACAGLRQPPTYRGRLGAEDAQAVARKARLVLQVTAAHGHDGLVLGALGCGAFGGPPAHIAEIFRDVLDAHPGVVPTVAPTVAPAAP